MSRMRCEIGTEKRRQMASFSFERMRYTLHALGLRFERLWFTTLFIGIKIRDQD